MDVHMSITERQNEIIELLDKEGSLSVARLAELTYISPSSIRRDLGRLEQMGYVKRTHGGATLPHMLGRAPSLPNRMQESVGAKRVIAKRAIALVKEGMSVMLDASSTSSYLVPHLARIKDVTVFTNNMATAMSAISHGLNTYCLGGSSIGGSVALGGSITEAAIASLTPDLLFFSSRGLSEDGIITDPTEEENHLRKLMIAKAKKSVFLCDGVKFGSVCLHRLATLDEIDYAVFDQPFPALKAKARIIDSDKE